MVLSYACESPYIYIHLLGQCVLRSLPKNSKLYIMYWVTNIWEIWVTEMIFPQWHSKTGCRSPDSQHLAEITTWYFSYFTVSSFYSTFQLNSEKFICYSKTTYLLPESILMWKWHRWCCLHVENREPSLLQCLWSISSIKINKILWIKQNKFNVAFYIYYTFSK